MTVPKAVALFVLTACASAVVAQTPPNPTARKPPAILSKTYYDIYEPSQRIHMRRETCAKGEISSGAYCIKACQPGYVVQEGSPVKCRSVNPLPPGSLPSYEGRKEIGVQPALKPPDKPLNIKPGA
jgi:hypothetical protein